MYRTLTDYLTPNKFSRPRASMKKVKGIVLHWVSNPNTTAKSNRDFFENKKNIPNSLYGSAHEIIENDLILLCVPENEITYNCGSKTYTDLCLKKLGTQPNYCTYSIECTHVNWDGNMTYETYNTLLHRCADLCKRFNLTSSDLYLHKEIVGWKDCHRFFTRNPNEWKSFKQKVNNLLNPQIPTEEVKPIEEVIKVYKDFDSVSYWAKPSVEKLKDAEIFVGDDQGNFNPKSPITREELAVVIDRVLTLMDKTGGKKGE